MRLRNHHCGYLQNQTPVSVFSRATGNKRRGETPERAKNMEEQIWRGSKEKDMCHHFRRKRRHLTSDRGCERKQKQKPDTDRMEAGTEN